MFQMFGAVSMLKIYAAGINNAEINITEINMAEMFSDYKWLICQTVFAGYMIVLAVMDIRWKKLSFMILLSGTVPLAAGFLCDREIHIILLAAGAAVGGIFLIISRVTEDSFGYGDSILIMIMGGFLGFWNILSLLTAAFSMAALFSIFMLIRKRFHRKSSFPFVPFLTAAYIGGMFFGIY